MNEEDEKQQHRITEFLASKDRLSNSLPADYDQKTFRQWSSAIDKKLGKVVLTEPDLADHFEKQELLFLEDIAAWRDWIINSDEARCEQKPVLEFLSIINKELKAVGSGCGERFVPYWVNDDDVTDDDVTDDDVTDDDVTFVVKDDDDEGLEESWSSGKWEKILHPEHWDRVKHELKLFIKYPKSYMRTGFLINGLGGLIIFGDKYRDKRYIDGTKITVTVHYWDYTPWMEPFFKSGVKALDPGAITLARLLWQKLELSSCHHSPSMEQTPTTADYQAWYYPDYLYRRRDLRMSDRAKEPKKSTVEDSTADVERIETLVERFKPFDERWNLIEKFWKLIEVVYLLLHRYWGWGSHEGLSPEVARVLFHTTHPSDAAVFVKDGSMRYTYVSPALTSFFNVSASHFLGRTDSEVFSCAGDWRMEQPLEIRDLLFEKVLSVTWLVKQVDDENLPKAIMLMSLAYHSEDGNLTPFGFGFEESPTMHMGVAPDLCVIKRMDGSQVGTNEHKSPAMQEVLKLLYLAAKRHCTVLLTGESGVGKDHFARYIHDQSDRAHGPYFSINCAAIAKELAESELFGHEKGAYTGAVGKKRGLLELAEGGTLLLNEIGDLDLHLQSKLLTFLETKTFIRVGGEKEISVDTRLLAATNKDLQEEVNERRFRGDLFYRLDVLRIKIPPLRERREDILMLTVQIIKKIKKEQKWEHDILIYPHTMTVLQQYDWPGNVRELRNVLERTLILTGGASLDVSYLRSDTKQPRAELEEESHAQANHGTSIASPNTTGLHPASMTDQEFKMMYEEVCVTMHDGEPKGVRGSAEAIRTVLGCSRPHVSRKIRRLKLPGVKKGRISSTELKVTIEQLESWLARHGFLRVRRLR